MKKLVCVVLVMSMACACVGCGEEESQPSCETQVEATESIGTEEAESDSLASEQTSVGETAQEESSATQSEQIVDNTDETSSSDEAVDSTATQTSTETKKEDAGKGTTKKPAESTKQPAETTKKPAETTKKPAETTKKPAETTKKPAETTKKPAETTKQPAETTRQPAETTTPAPKASPTPAGSNPSMTREEMALACALEVIEESHCLDYGMSRSQLIEILKNSDYTDAEATYAADHCGLNWNEEAVRSGKHLSDSFSRKIVIEILMGNEWGFGFARSEAIYGADNSGGDYFQNAIRTAKTEATGHISYEGMIMHLTNDYGFQYSEALVAVCQPDIDWGEQAYEYYLHFLSNTEDPISRYKMVEKIKKEGFKQEHAEAAADLAELDWNMMAYLTACNYINNCADSAATPKDTKHVLQSAAFTPSEIEYAIANVDWDDPAYRYAKDYKDNYSGYKVLNKGSVLLVMKQYGEFTEEQANAAIDKLDW